jgi:hypothetical protein
LLTLFAFYKSHFFNGYEMVKQELILYKEFWLFL